MSASVLQNSWINAKTQSQASGVVSFQTLSGELTLQSTTIDITTPSSNVINIEAQPQASGVVSFQTLAGELTLQSTTITITTPSSNVINIEATGSTVPAVLSIAGQVGNVLLTSEDSSVIFNTTVSGTIDLSAQLNSTSIANNGGSVAINDDTTITIFTDQAFITINSPTTAEPNQITISSGSNLPSIELANNSTILIDNPGATIPSLISFDSTGKISLEASAVLISQLALQASPVNFVSYDTGTTELSYCVLPTPTVIAIADGSNTTAVDNGGGSWSVNAVIPVLGIVAGSNTTVSNADGSYTINAIVPVLDVIAGSNTTVSNADGSYTINATVPVSAIVDGTNTTAVDNGSGNWAVNVEFPTPTELLNGSGSVLVDTNGFVNATTTVSGTNYTELYMTSTSLYLKDPSTDNGYSLNSSVDIKVLGSTIQIGAGTNQEILMNALGQYIQCNSTGEISLNAPTTTIPQLALEGAPTNYVCYDTGTTALSYCAIPTPTVSLSANGSYETPPSFTPIILTTTFQSIGSCSITLTAPSRLWGTATTVFENSAITADYDIECYLLVDSVPSATTSLHIPNRISGSLPFSLSFGISQRTPIEPAATYTTQLYARTTTASGGNVIASHLDLFVLGNLA